MNLKEIGEFGFINRFACQYDSLIAKDTKGIGDDCAVLPFNDTQNYVVTTDLLVEDIHFLKDKILPEELGYKSLAVNLSDIAAMGASPQSSFLSIGIPADTSVEYLDKLMKGYHTLSQKYHTPLLGGDTTKSSDKLVINVLVIGVCNKTDLRFRSMAQEGDVICVTNTLGDSAAGLQVLLNNISNNSTTKYLLQKHHLPEPRIEEAVWLAQQQSVHAMMDISDGISSDLMHILRASRVAAEIELAKIPLSEHLQKASEEYQWNSLDLACSGGEDYELLFTIRAADYFQVKKAFENQFSSSIQAIGSIKKGQPQIIWLKNGIETKLGKNGFNHFTNN